MYLSELIEALKDVQEHSKTDVPVRVFCCENHCSECNAIDTEDSGECTVVEIHTVGDNYTGHVPIFGQVVKMK